MLIGQNVGYTYRVKFLLSDLATLLQGEAFGPDIEIESASIDSRSISPGCLFVPIVAERDGHQFISGALTAGAAAYLTEQEPVGGSGIRVAATPEALSRMGVAARSRLHEPVIGVTGSVGKTSVKDLIRAACSHEARTHANAASFNNELGLPLTLVNAPSDTEVTIVEMGARGIGHIAKLCAIAKPTIGVVTRVALAHSELFGSIEGVATAKGELIESLPTSGVAVLNAADPNVLAMASRSQADVVLYGPSGADVFATDVEFDAVLRGSFRINSPQGSADVRLAVSGAHMVDNAVAALATGLAAGLRLEGLVAGIEAAKVSPWRMEITKADSGGIVINDAYNANPTSLRAALAALTSLDVQRRVAVLGAMAELGDEGPEEHLAIAAEAAAAGIEVIAVSAPAYGPVARHVSSQVAAIEAISSFGEGDAVLVKGSRVAALERVAAMLLT